MAEHYFVRIEDAKGMRRKVLESSKASLNVLKSYNSLHRIRSKKRTMMKMLRRELKDLTLLVNRMEELLPSLTKKEIRELQKNEPLPKLEEQQFDLPRLEPGGVFLGHPEELPEIDEKIEEDIKEDKEVPTSSLEEKMRRIEEKLSNM